MHNDTPSPSITALLATMKRLRSPDGGCAWDIAQDFASLTPHVIEEAYEVIEAAESGNNDHLREELGDLLLQVVFYAQIASENSLFNFEDVANAINSKLITRHPHIFGDGSLSINTPEEVSNNWEKIKAEQRDSEQQSPISVLDGISNTLPELARAEKLQQRAARVGFDWPDIQGVVTKILEELTEVINEIDASYNKEDRENKDDIAEEIGDLIFVTVNLARKLGINSGQALRYANRKFERRFRFVEQQLAAAGKKPSKNMLDEMERLWTEAKKQEKRKKR